MNVVQDSPAGRNATVTAPPSDAATIIADLTRVIAEATRYPADILEPHADFEHDLGIDSVKLGEIIVLVRQRYAFGDDVKIEAEHFRTIASAAAAIGDIVRGRSAVAVASTFVHINGASAPVEAAPPAVPTVGGDLVETITNVVAETTRYPREILEKDADFEHDLGIDSVKLGEIVVVLRNELRISETTQLPLDRFRTIAQAAAALSELLAPPAPVSRNGARHAEPPPAAVVPPPGSTPRFVDLVTLATQNGGRPFKGRTVLVTGSGHGIGRDLAVMLASLGAKVVVNAFHSRDAGEATTREIQEAGGDAHFIWGSVANERQRIAMFEEIENRLGGLDFLICNASNGLIGPFEQIREEDWEKGFRTNVVGLHHMALLASKLMAKRGGGKIVTLSSTASYRHINGFGCMAALKSAVESLTRTMAVEFERYNVSVTCLSPGPVEGELITKFPDATRQIAHWKELSIGKQLVVSHEVANFVTFLLLGAVPSLNGSVIVFDHGLSYAL
ncbi:MAG TPA: SDR family oxidoreductase [Candidatus Acidoferrales bacterium]|nr:SDR family oxidoreductase [Candidatus Acidoferrales bacterium]